MTVRRLRTSWPAIVIATTLLVAGCHATPPSSGVSPVVVSPAPPPITPSAAETSILPHTADDQSADEADNPIDHVIAISIDGLNPRVGARENSHLYISRCLIAPATHPVSWVSGISALFSAPTGSSAEFSTPSPTGLRYAVTRS
jgi:hypothetical protein